MFRGPLGWKNGDETYHGFQETTRTASRPGRGGVSGAAGARGSSEEAADGIELALLHVDDRCCQRGGGEGGDDGDSGKHFVCGRKGVCFFENKV